MFRQTGVSLVMTVMSLQVDIRDFAALPFYSPMTHIVSDEIHMPSSNRCERASVSTSSNIFAERWTHLYRSRLGKIHGCKQLAESQECLLNTL